MNPLARNLLTTATLGCLTVALGSYLLRCRTLAVMSLAGGGIAVWLRWYFEQPRGERGRWR